MGQLSHYHRGAIQRHEAVVVVGERDCDICKTGDTITVATVDGKTKMGPWANMCDLHHEEFGVGLGIGRGQKLIYQEYDPTKPEKTEREKRSEIAWALRDGDYDEALSLVGDGDIADYV